MIQATVTVTIYTLCRGLPKNNYKINTNFKQLYLNANNYTFDIDNLFNIHILTNCNNNKSLVLRNSDRYLQSN